MKLFRREWIFTLLVVAFISASAHATRDELTAQAATDMRCNSVSVIQSSDTKFLATGCGQDKTYTCGDDGACTMDDDGANVHASTGGDTGDDAAAEAIAEAIMEAGCACASGAMTSHHSHTSHSSSHKRKKD